MLLKIENGNGMLIDISRKGLRLSAEKIPEGETVDVSMKILGKHIQLKGTIHWVEIKQTLDEEPFEIGLSIREPGEEFIDYVEKL